MGHEADPLGPELLDQIGPGQMATGDHRRRIGHADFANCRAPGMDSDDDVHLAVPLPAEPVVDVGDDAFDRRHRLQG